MKRIKLDKIDRKILDNLQRNGRITNIECISAPPCLRRVRALEEAKFIKGYFARLDGTVLGYGLSIFALIKLVSQAESDLKEFEQACDNIERIRECHMLSGEVDFMLRIVAKDWDEYQKFLTEELTQIV